MKMEFARGFVNTDAASAEFFHVNNCGYYIDPDDIHLRRPHGRQDYQLIFVQSGALHVSIDGAERRVPAGYALFYAPGQPQFYRSYGDEHIAYYWIHFSGRDCPEILRSIGITEPIFPMASGSAFVEGCHSIIRELKGAKNELYLNGLALCMLARIRGEEQQRFRPVIEQMYTDVERGTASDYAELAGMSPSHFIRCFKADYRVTPNVYLTQLKMEKARLLLRETDLKVQEIAARLGYEDPFYFSNAFKKVVGVSPTGYRRA